MILHFDVSVTTSMQQNSWTVCIYSASQDSFCTLRSPYLIIVIPSA